MRWYAVSANCSVKRVRRRVSTGPAAAVREGQPNGSGKPASVAGFLIETLGAIPNITLRELPEALQVLGA